MGKSHLINCAETSVFSLPLQEKIHAAKAQLELKRKDNKKGFLYVESKRRMRENIGLVPDEVSHLTSRVVGEAETFSATFAFVFNTDEGPWSPVVGDCDRGNSKLPPTPSSLETRAGGARVFGPHGVPPRVPKARMLSQDLSHRCPSLRGVRRENSPRLQGR